MARMVSDVLGYLYVETGIVYHEIAFLMSQNNISCLETSHILPHI